MAGTPDDPAAEMPADSPSQPEEYVRRPIPSVALVDAHGAEVDVAAMAQGKALLLVFAPPDDRRLAEHLRHAAREWSARLPLIRVQLVLSDGQSLDAEDSTRPPALFDPAGRCLGSFGVEAPPMAVLLGTDGLLAGGPATGLDDVNELVERVIEQLTGHWTDAESLLLHAPSLSSSLPLVGLLVSTFGAPGFVALQLEGAKRFAPGAPVLIHDDCSGNPELALLAERYGAGLVSTVTRRGHASGDVAAFAAGLRWGDSLGLEYVVKISRRFVAVKEWLPEFTRLAADRPPTIGAPDGAFGWQLPTEFVGLRVPDWISRLPELQAYEEGYVEELLGDLAQSMGPTALFEFLGASRILDNRNFLWYSFADSHRYAALAAEWGLVYTSADFNTRANLFSD